MLLLYALVALSQLACTGARVTGGISPSAFQFTNVLPHPGGPREPGGWKAAQVLILVGHLSPLFPDASTCDIEVGMPEVNLLGPIRDEVAQLESARAADEAARLALQQRLPTAALCIRFRTEMQRLMNAPDPQTAQLPVTYGTRVTRFQTAGLTHTTFP